LSIEDDLYQWRRSIAEINNLNNYNVFVAGARGQKHHTRRRGERVSQQTHQDYLAYIYADKNPKDDKGSKQALKKNLEFGRRWSILINGYTTENNNVVPGLGLGILLLCGPSIKTKM
jgi:hypothetical protein